MANNVKTKILKADNFLDAFVLFKEFKNALQKNSFQKIQLKKEVQIPTLLIECFAYYMGFLNNENVPLHKRRFRSKKALDAFDLDFRLYKEALEFYNIDCSILKFTDVNDDLVGYLHSYLLNQKKYANKTYNNVMSNLSAFTTHIISKYRLNYTNPFLGVEKLHVETKNLTVEENEFQKLLNTVTLENGFKIVNRMKRNRTYKKSMYRSWLCNGFLLGLYTGGRSEEIVNLNWSKITLNNDGSFKSIGVIHYKLNKAKGHLVSERDSITKDFTITKELGALLLAMDYESNKGKNQFLLAPEKRNRLQVGRELSAGFSHYYGLLKTGKEIKFKNLRKTFITSAYIQYGEASTALTGHKGTSIIQSNYYDKEVTQKVAQKEFQVFKPTEN